MFGSFNFLQILLLIPLSGVYLPTKVSELIKVMNYSLLTFYDLNCDDLSVETSDAGECGYSQPNALLNFIGIKSGGTIINIHLIAAIFILIVLTHTVLALINWCLVAKQKEGKCARFMMGVYRIFTFTVYIRYILEAYLAILLASISELERIETGTTMKFRSFLTAVGI